MFVKPARKGLLVRDPLTMKHVPEKGMEVPDHPYWLRRERDGDIVIVEKIKKVQKVKEEKEEVNK